MSIESRRHQYGTVFDHWQIGELLGVSKNGQTAVFHLRHKESSQEESAVKVITLIEEQGNLSEFSPQRKAEYEAELEKRKQHALNEVQIMYALKGYTNIVSYEDRVTEPWTEVNSFGCDLLIRMELLRDLRKVIQTGYIFSEAEIIQIGKDICTALTLCHSEKEPIIHRDIKPENIFVNSRGTYKLGDFGVSRILDKCHGRTATTVIGTPAYLAPEQLRKGYDERVDIYSLGLVLYELSNRNRLPFSDTSYIEEKAIQIRIAGNKLPAPCEASPEFAKVILKACAFNRNARYHTAQEMLEALNKLSAVKSAKRIAKKMSSADNKQADNCYATIPADNISSERQEYATVPATPDRDQCEESTRKFHALLEKAEAGDPSSQNSVGCCYYNGDGVGVDYSVAVEWFRKAEKNGDCQAAFNLGLCYEYGNGVERNDSRAEMYYRSAARAGNAAAQYKAGRICSSGNYYEKHDASIWYFLASRQKNKNALTQIERLKPEDWVRIGDFLFHGEHTCFGSSSLETPVDTCSAVRWYTKAAESGYPYAEYLLGYCYENGTGVEIDLSRAFYWYEKAAHHHEISGMRCLGECYMHGKGTRANPEKGVKWLKRAARKGSIIALKDLGDCYYAGLGVKQSYKDAANYYLKPANLGDEEALDKLNLATDKLNLSTQNKLQKRWINDDEESKRRLACGHLHHMKYYKEKRQKKDGDEHYINELRREEYFILEGEIAGVLFIVSAVITLLLAITLWFNGVSLWVTIPAVIALSLVSGLMFSGAMDFLFDRKWAETVFFSIFTCLVLVVISAIIIGLVEGIMWIF